MLIEALRTIANLPGLYHLRRAYYRRAFFHPNHHRGSRCWGTYENFAAAEAEARRLFGKADYDEPRIVKNSLEVFMATNLFDWPVIFHLDRAIRERGAMSVVDFGGHIGVKYYAFRPFLKFPPGFRWSVVDVPAMTSAGRARRQELGAGDELHFHEHAEQVGPADILFCSGSLQYTPFELTALASSFGKPQTILLSKIPVTSGQAFVTLDNLGHARVPYRIYAQDELEAQMRDMGYRELARWNIPEKDFSIPFTRPRFRVSVGGMAWSL